MKLTSIYYSPSIERIVGVGHEELTDLDADFMLNTLLYGNYELIGYFYDN